MKPLLHLGVVTVLAVLWALNHTAAADLRTQIVARRQENSELAALRLERARLEQRHAAAQRQTADRPAAVTVAVAPVPPPRTELLLGEWLSPDSLQNRGQLTANAAVETALWAAAGGEVSVFHRLLQLDDVVRGRAHDILAQLSPAARAAYPSAEDLIAAFTIKAIPIGEAQLVWQQEHGPDEAVACLFIRDPAAAASPEPEPAPLATTREAAIQQAKARAPMPKADRVPPMGPPNSKTTVAYLSLRRTETGWRLVVPPSAVEKIAKELGAGK